MNTPLKILPPPAGLRRVGAKGGFGCATALLVVAFLSGCGPTGPHRDHVSLSKFPDSLRAAFNADTGKVRAVVLVSPT